ncbi:PaaI family thioesterase [Roseitranquillus sediminis]|uniref:PaaI family thioesterase n=1 Tax=Roseitranquillus sediminis TaxID=2809051 RepID=UPI001D0C46D0|nr:PaaI family thioesterase [Roseitranquillus sediminis]MBM9593390.1 PaaI family thioesterase [Roseitranquillus sediminis]
MTVPFDFPAHGYRPHEDEGFLGHVGPIWEKVENGDLTLAFQAEGKHANLLGVVQGGMLMTMADRLLGLFGRMHNEHRPQATVQLDVHFLGSVKMGDVVIGRPRLVRNTRTLFFLEGTLYVDETEVLSARGVWKKLGT